MPSHFRPELRVLTLASVLMFLVGCPGGDAPPTGQKPLGSVCTTNNQCQKGLCLTPPGDTEKRCVATCTTEGRVCPTGGRCVLFEDGPATLACSLPPHCSTNAECGANAACSTEGGGLGSCQCAPNFYGDSATACSACTPENARQGCTLRTLSLPEVKGVCRSLDGATVAGECVAVEDCPDPTRFGCFGYLPAVVADPPCGCADLRGLDLSGATDLRGLAGAWFNEKTKWPEGFDSSTAGALGPGAKLPGIDLSGRGLLSVERRMVGGERLASPTGANTLRHGRVVSGSLQVQLGAAVFSDEGQHGVLVGASGGGEVDYTRGTLRLDGVSPEPGAHAEAAYRYRVYAVPLRALDTTTTPTRNATTFELVGTGAPILPQSATVRIAPEPLVPDAAPDGRRTSFSFTGEHALALAPIVPDSVRVLVGDLELTDDAAGNLRASDGSTGTVNYGTGAVTLALKTAPRQTEALAASYQATRTVALEPDQAFNGSRTYVSFSRSKALPMRPLLPGSVRLSLGGVTLSDAGGSLVGSDGSTGTLDYETGEILLRLATAPAATTRASVTFTVEAAVTLTDRDGPRLVGDLGGRGTIDYEAARVYVELPARLHPSTTALIDFERHAERTLVTEPALDGTAAEVSTTLGPGPIGRGSVRLGQGPEVLTPQPAFDGATRDFEFSLSKKPVAPGTLGVEVGGVRLSDLRGDGTLSGVGGNKGTLNYETGAVKVQLAKAPAASAKASAGYARRWPSVGLTPDLPPNGSRRELSFTGDKAVPAPLWPGSAVVTVTEGLVPDPAHDGVSTRHTYQLERTPVAPGTVQLRVGDLTFLDRDTPGKLQASDGSTGTLDPETGLVDLKFATARAFGTPGAAKYEVESFERTERTLTPDVAFNGVKTDHAFSGANALGPAVLPGSLRVIVDSVPLVPDAAYDGIGTRYTYSGVNALLHRPVVPGSVEVRVGNTTLRDSLTPGVLSAADASSGTLDASTGVLSIDFSRPPPAGTSSTVAYRVQVTDKSLTPDKPFDGRRTRFVFAESRALSPVPIVPGSVTLVVGAVALTETSQGRLSGPGGSEALLDYDTGKLVVTLPAAPPAGAPVRVTHQSRASLMLRDSASGDLTGSDGSSGKVQYSSGALNITFTAAPAPGTLARATFSRRATLVPEPPFDGSTQAHRFTLAKTRVAPGSVTLTIGSTRLRETTDGKLVADDGSTGQVDARTGEVKVQLATPAPVGTPVLADYRGTSEVVFHEAAKAGELRGSDGSLGTLDSRTGVMGLSLRLPPKPGTLVTLERSVPAEVVVTDKNGALTAEGVTGTLDMSDGEATLKFATPPPAGTALTVTYTQAGAQVERTNLKGIALAGANLSRANLSYTDLRNADLANADLSLADLTGADLRGANLRGTKLAGATLKNADVEDANLLGADLSGADLTGVSGIDPTRLSLPRWYEAGLTDCKEISVSDCVAGNYYPEQLVKALLAGRIDPRKDGLEGAVFAGADLRSLGDLTGANLKGANLKGANLRGLRLAGADFTGAILDGAILTEVQAPDTVCPGTASPCYDGGRVCRGSTQACVPKPGGELKLTSATLTGALLDRAVITGANATKAVMAGVDLSGTDASRAKFNESTLERVRTSTATNLSAVDLTQANLLGADLRGVKLDAAKLVGTDLSRIVADESTRAEGATFTGVNLTEACLTNSTMLRGATLEGIRAQRASLAGANLQGTNFTKADLSGATLASDGAGSGDPCHCTPEGGPSVCGFTKAQGAVFKSATLAGTNFNATDMRGVNLELADLRGARLERTDLRNAILNKANLSGNNLRTAILSSAKLVDANLSWVDLSGNEVVEPLLNGADLTGADLRRTVLQRAVLTGALLDRVNTDSATQMRGANLELSTIRGCIRANLSDAVLKNAALLNAGFTTPGNKPFDAATDFNCRIDFEGALLPLQANKECGAAASFPSGWLEAGRASNGVYAKERLLAKASAVRTQLECAYLPDVDLRGRDLSGANLNGARLDKTRLGRDDVGGITNLSGAQMQRAQLTAANAEWANLSGVNLSGAVLTGTSLEHADLRGANLSKVVLDSSTKFQLAKYSCPGQSSPGCTVFPDYPTFRWRQLKMIGPQSDLGGADLSGYPGLSSPPVDLRGANLKDAKFNWTDVSGVSFNGANMESAAFSHANVSGANFSGANLKSSNFSSATITSGTVYSGANIMQANFIASSGTPSVDGSLCNVETAFNSSKAAYVFLLKISIEGSFPLYFPVITLQFVPGWNVAGQCCFPVNGGIRIGC